MPFPNEQTAGYVNFGLPCLFNLKLSMDLSSVLEFDFLSTIVFTKVVWMNLAASPPGQECWPGRAHLSSESQESAQSNEIKSWIVILRSAF